VESKTGHLIKINGEEIKLLFPTRPAGSDLYMALCDFSGITGCTYEAHPVTGALTIRKGLRYLELAVNSPKAVINDRTATVSPPPAEVDGIVYVPFKYTAGGLGYSVGSSGDNALTLAHNPFIKINRAAPSGSINDFLPRGAEFVAPPQNTTAETDRYVSKDLDGDGNEEHASFYKTNGGKYGLLLFGGREDSYTRLLQKEDFFIPDYLGTGLFDKSKPFLLAGWNLGDPLGSILEIYALSDSGLDIVYTGMYHKIEMGDFDSDGTDELALWQKDLGETYQITVLKWNGSRFAPLEFCPGYYEKVLKYYNLQPAGLSPARALNFRKAEAALRAGRPDLAIKHSTDGMYLPRDYPGDQTFQGLKGIALVAAKQYAEALPLLKAALGERGGTVWPGARVALAQCYFAAGASERGLVELGRAVSQGNDWAGFEDACKMLGEQLAQ
jgi:hypothetical protein